MTRFEHLAYAAIRRAEEKHRKKKGRLRPFLIEAVAGTIESQYKTAFEKGKREGRFTL